MIFVRILVWDQIQILKRRAISNSLTRGALYQKNRVYTAKDQGKSYINIIPFLPVIFCRIICRQMMDMKRLVLFKKSYLPRSSALLTFVFEEK